MTCINTVRSGIRMPLSLTTFHSSFIAINNQYRLNQHIRLNQLEPTKSISVIVSPPPLNLPSTSIGPIFQSCFQAAKVIVHLAERPVTVSPNLAKHNHAIAKGLAAEASCEDREDTLIWTIRQSLKEPAQCYRYNQLLQLKIITNTNS